MEKDNALHTRRHQATLTPGFRAVLRVPDGGWTRRTLLGCAALAVLLISSTATAQDHCTLYSGPNWDGASAQYSLPAAGSHSGYAWGSTSVRRVGSQLNVSGNPVYRNAESIRIRAHDSDVVLYVYQGDHFNGLFQAVRCSRGNTCNWRYGTMRNQVRSFICQRDDFIDISQGLAQIMRNLLLPTYILADMMTATVHEAVQTQSHRFYNLNLQYGRMIWSTAYNLCREINCTSLGENEWRRRYRDYLQYSYRVRGRLRADAWNYNIDINLWLQPRLVGGQLNLLERGWTVRVTQHIWTNLIRNRISDQVRAQYPGLGARITNEIRNLLNSQLGTAQTNLILNNNRQLVFSHPCSYILQRVGNPGHVYTTSQIENICGATTPVHLAAPGIRLLK